jgi:hypothetical protein
MTGSPPPAAEHGLLARALGIITSPTTTFRAVVQSPRPASILLLVCLTMGLVSAVPLFTEGGRRAAVELQLRMAQEQSAEPLPAEAREMMARMEPYLGYVAFASTFIFVPAAAMATAGLCWLLFNVILGGTAEYRQVLGVTTHSHVILALGTVLAAPIQYLQGTMTAAGPFHLGALAPTLTPTSFMAKLLGALTFFGLWQYVVLAIGLAVLYRRKPVGLTITMLVLYVAFTAIFFVGLPGLFTRR